MNLKAVCWRVVGVGFGLFACALIIVTVNRTLRAEDNTDRVTEAYQGFQDGKCKSCHPAIWPIYCLKIHHAASQSVSKSEIAAVSPLRIQSGMPIPW